MDDDIDQDDAKRKSRNLSEKKRRDQFNLLVNELNSIVFSANRKLDKSTVLQTTIAFLKQQNEKTAQSRLHEIPENWKPSFLSNEEFLYLMLEAVPGFIIVLSSNGQIQYASESIITLMGHLPSDIVGSSIYDLIYEKENQEIYSVLSNPTAVIDPLRNSLNTENQVRFSCYLKKGGLKGTDEVVYEQVQFVGFFRYDIQSEEEMPSTSLNYHESGVKPKLLFVGIGRLQTPQLVREMSAIDSTKSEFTSRQNLEWKFLFLDHRATPIIGYLPFEVLGTSGYDYYHFDDLDNIANDHETLMMKGGETSCFYRFLTKSQQWIWLQTHSYLTYHQWTLKPEFVVCTHRVFSYAEVLRLQSCNKRETMMADVMNKRTNIKVETNKNVGSSPSPSRSVDSSRRDAKRIKSNTPSESTQSQARIQTSYSTSRERDRNTFEQSPSSVVNPQQLTETITALQTSQTLSPSYAGSFQHSANIPVQFVVPTDVHSPVVPPLQHNVIMSSSQSQIQSQLQKKHEELQQAIYEQQRELQRVSEQLHMTRYGPSSILNVPNFPEIQASYFVGSVDLNIDQSIRHVNLIGVDQYSNDADYQNRRNAENQINVSNAGTSDVHLENVNDHMPRAVVLQDKHYREFSHSHQQWINENAQPPIQDEKNCTLITNDNHLMQKSAINIVHVHSSAVTDSQSVEK